MLRSLALSKHSRILDTVNIRVAQYMNPIAHRGKQQCERDAHAVAEVRGLDRDHHHVAMHDDPHHKHDVEEVWGRPSVITQRTY